MTQLLIVYAAGALLLVWVAYKAYRVFFRKEHGHMCHGCPVSKGCAKDEACGSERSCTRVSGSERAPRCTITPPKPSPEA
jgi:hypothetical protein